jgi:hypothetical protein
MGQLWGTPGPHEYHRIYVMVKKKVYSLQWPGSYYELCNCLRRLNLDIPTSEQDPGFTIEFEDACKDTYCVHVNSESTFRGLLPIHSTKGNVQVYYVMIKNLHYTSIK